MEFFFNMIIQFFTSLSSNFGGLLAAIIGGEKTQNNASPPQPVQPTTEQVQAHREQQIQQQQQLLQKFDNLNAQVTAQADAVVARINGSKLPDAEKQKAIAELENIKRGAANIPEKDRLAYAQNPASFEKNANATMQRIQNVADGVDQKIGVQKAEEEKRTSIAGRAGDVAAGVSKYSGYASLACFAGAGLCWVAGGIMTATGVGAIAGVPLMAVGTALGMSAGGVALATSTVSGLAAGGAHIVNGEGLKGGVEALCCIPGIKQIGLVGRVGKAVAAETIQSTETLLLNGGASQAKTLWGRFSDWLLGNASTGIGQASLPQYASGIDALKTSADVAFRSGTKGFHGAMSGGAQKFAEDAAKNAASQLTGTAAQTLEVAATQALRNSANTYMKKIVIGNGVAAGGHALASEITEPVIAFVEPLLPRQTPSNTTTNTPTQPQPRF